MNVSAALVAIVIVVCITAVFVRLIANKERIHQIEQQTRVPQPKNETGVNVGSTIKE